MSENVLCIPRPSDPLEAAAIYHGGYRKLADAIGYSTNSIGTWRNRNVISKRAAMAIELSTNHAVTCAELMAFYDGEEKPAPSQIDVFS